MSINKQKGALIAILSLIALIIPSSLIAQGVTPGKSILEPVYIQTIEDYAYERVIDVWGNSQWKYFNELIDRESDWDNDAQNPNSTAFGLGQFLDSTWDDVGCVKTSDAKTQIDCTIAYVEQRHKTPEKAIIFHDKNNWY